MNTRFTSMRDLAGALARAMNLIDMEVENHHEMVAYFAANLAETMDLPENERKLAFTGALLHDIGSVVLTQHNSLMELELHPQELAKAGAAFLKLTEAGSAISDVVNECQSPWQKLKQFKDKVKSPWLLGQIIHVADMATLFVDDKKPILNQVSHIQECIHRGEGSEFCPEVLDAFDKLCKKESVWMDMVYRPCSFLNYIDDSLAVSLDETIKLTEIMSRIIDFRSPFTAMHSAGVAASAEYIAGKMGMSGDECKMMKIAGNLHDVGKLKISREILEKPGKLTDSEFNIMKEHSYYTYIILKDIAGFEQITAWAAFHHEKLNGSGYPFHFEGASIPLGSRIMAVADVFSAIAEDRPYRKGMDREQAVEVLQTDVKRGALSKGIVDIVLENYEEIDEIRKTASEKASRRYQESLKRGES